MTRPATRNAARAEALFDWDDSLRGEAGIRLLCGVDEAGRGPLAGPVVAAAVVLPPDIGIEGLDDSKRLTPRRRETLEAVIRERALDLGLGLAEVEEIDRLNILRATFLAMHRAVENLGTAPEFLLVDGRDFPFDGRRGRSLVRGDSTSAAVAAAGILAKQARDRLMLEAEVRYPGYGFASHKGYGTPRHLAMIRELGRCPLHRRSFRCRADPREEVQL